MHAPTRSSRSLLYAAMAVVLGLLLVLPAAAADVLILTDGTRLEGTIRRSGQSYTVTAEDGTVTEVPADQVAGVELTGSSGRRDQLDLRLDSLRRSVQNLDDIDAIISRYESFIAQNEDTEVAAQAREELAQWREVKARGFVKHGREWVAPAERNRRIRDAFLEVQEARRQIKEGQVDQAQRTLERMLRANPEDVSALYLTAVLDIRRGELNKARQGLERVRDFEPSHAPTLLNLAVINFSLDRQPRGLLFLGEAMNAEPGNREILDNVAEALNLLEDKAAEGRQAEQVRQAFLSQDAALRQRMAERGLYRWGSTWVDREQLAELEALEQEIRQRLAEIEQQYTAVQDEIGRIERQYEANERFMQRLQRERNIIVDGKIYQTPLPPEYYEVAREQEMLVAQREARLRDLAQLEQQAAQQNARYPTPPFKGKLTPVGEDGVPVIEVVGGGPAGQGEPPPQEQEGAATTRDGDGSGGR